MRENLHELGMEMLAKIDGEIGKRVISSMSEISPDMADYIVEFGFGEIYSREGLPVNIKEIVVVAGLVALGKERQLKVHLSAALNTGVTKKEIIEVIILLSIYAGFPAALNALIVAKEVFSERGIL